ncbi:MAG: LLM class flavin-dependent oxidoreductase [Nostocoides sp.]
MVEVGVALWSMQRTHAAPSPGWPQLYHDLQTDARLAESLGYDSLWVAEHRFWYDGWCPQPLVAAASALSATSRLVVGTAMHLLPQHDPDRSSQTFDSLRTLFSDRFQLGVSLGYRDEEYDGVGLLRSQRGRLMDAALDRLADQGRLAQELPTIWVGGMAPAAIRRAARRGLSLLLPPTLSADDIRRIAAQAREISAQAGVPPGRIGMVKDIWVTDGSAQERDAHVTRLDVHYREYAGAWWMLKGRPGFSQPDLLDKQMRRTAQTAIIGPIDQVISELTELTGAGVDMLALSISSDVTRDLYHDHMALIADRVLPDIVGVPS